MAQLIIIFDPSDKLEVGPMAMREKIGLRDAVLSIPDDLEGKDIYEIARKLAELLLEQLEKG